MKQNEIIKIIEERFRTINKQSRKLISNFNPEAIHEFRMEVKKFRSNLRLISYLQVGASAALVPKKVKTFYGYAGIIGNLQLQQELINNYCKKIDAPIPKNYLQIMEAEETFWKKEAGNFIEDNKNFYDDEETVIENIPDNLKTENIVAFLESKINEIKKQLTHLRDDEALHKVRKYLNDIVYNWNLVKDHSTVLPQGLNTEKEILSIIATLGKFRDVCIAINHLQPTYIDRIRNVEEKQLLQHIEQDWQAQKEEIKEGVIITLTRSNIVFDASHTLAPLQISNSNNLY